MLEKINKLTNWQATLIIAVVGLAVFFTGLNNPFMGDDGLQIVSNPVVHSVKNVGLLFQGSTFYTGNGLAPLSGVYYRPLMSAVFSLLYTLFGPHPIYFHVLQLLLCIGGAAFLYLFFRYSFKPALSLFLSLIFLVHPINSQTVFALASMQDALFFFFGILALWLILRTTSIKSLFLVAICLSFSLLSKETGALFVILALLLLYWFDERRRLYSFMGIMVLPIILYLVLKTNAVGFLGTNPRNAPIDNLSLPSRLMTAPSILSFYVVTLVAPLKLARAYYWVNPGFSISHVLLPLIIDVALIAIFVYFALPIRKKTNEATFYTYTFFGAWLALGMLITLQIIPLDMTASMTWFYFPMAGLLGMIGVIATTYKPSVPIKLIISSVIILLIAIFGFRTALRGLDYGDSYTISRKDISASKEDYAAYSVVAAELNKQGDYIGAKAYATRSVEIFPSMANYENLGNALTYLGDYHGAVKAYNHALSFGNNSILFESISNLMLVYDNFDSNQQFLIKAINIYPDDSALLMNFAIFEYKYKDKNGAAENNAKIAIERAAMYGPVPKTIYDSITKGQPLTYPVAGKNIVIR